MLYELRELIGRESAREIVAGLASAPFTDGKATAQGSAREAKNNYQLDPTSPIAVRLGNVILSALGRSEAFKAIAIPRVILPMTFSKYTEGMCYGEHLDLPIMATAAGPLRTDLSMTVWLLPRDAYDGGELVIRTDAGERAFKGDAGDAVLYSSSTIHRVAPVTRGERIVAISWVQSLVRDPEQRAILQKLAATIGSLQERGGLEAEILRVRQIQHHLMRMWADC